VNDEFSEHKTLQTKRIQDLERTMTVLRADLAELKNRDTGLRTELDKLWQIVVGDDDMNFPGLLDRIKEVERRPSLAQRVMLLSMAMTSVTSLATLAVILFK
jgi:type II secretory pathway component PulJ